MARHEWSGGGAISEEGVVHQLVSHWKFEYKTRHICIVLCLDRGTAFISRNRAINAWADIYDSSLASETRPTD